MGPLGLEPRISIRVRSGYRGIDLARVFSVPTTYCSAE
jgi:hypothetical protein